MGTIGQERGQNSLGQIEGEIVQKQPIASLKSDIVIGYIRFTSSLDQGMTKMMGTESITLEWEDIVDTEGLFYLIHRVDRLAYELDLPPNVRRTTREEIAQDLLDEGILSYDNVDNLIQDLNQVDKDYSSCTKLIGANLFDKQGLLNTLASRILHKLEQDHNPILRVLIIGTASDVLETNLMSEIRKTLKSLQ